MCSITLREMGCQKAIGFVCLREYRGLDKLEKICYYIPNKGKQYKINVLKAWGKGEIYGWIQRKRIAATYNV